MTVYVIPIEPIDTRYTVQWYNHIPQLLDIAGAGDIVVVNGEEVPPTPTPGAFLDFGATNIYKSSQLAAIADMFRDGAIKDGDKFLYTDAWNPTVIQLRYMAELLGKKIEIHGLWHAGSYDPQDFLGRLVGDKPWVRNAECSMFYCYDVNWFATRFHSNMFLRELLGVEVLFAEDETDEFITGCPDSEINRLKLTGWPMEYMPGLLESFANTPKRDKIIFPHRLAPEKQLEIFRDLAAAMPEYEWFVAQEQQLTKDEYHQHLAESKIAFSANLQETLGISMYEAALVGTYPLVPDRLSYSEMWAETYPSEWTKNWDSYQANKTNLMARIREIMGSNQQLDQRAKDMATEVGTKFFTATALVQELVRA
jgi:hypothetical protein